MLCAFSIFIISLQLETYQKEIKDQRNLIGFITNKFFCSIQQFYAYRLFSAIAKEVEESQAELEADLQSQVLTFLTNIYEGCYTFVQVDSLEAELQAAHKELVVTKAKVEEANRLASKVQIFCYLCFVIVVTTRALVSTSSITT